MTATVFDDRACLLGEGALWHPRRQCLFWFDIMGKRLLTRAGERTQSWAFDRHVSAAGWVDDTTLLIATETDLACFDIETGATERIVALEADNPTTRSNDGRADPCGGFWIGTMGKQAEPKMGAVYRYYRGDVQRLRNGVTIPNAICFAPDGHTAYVADTADHIVWRIVLEPHGWPTGDWHIWLDHRKSGLNPDGAVVDAQGQFWCAEWGASRVACYAPNGALVHTVPLPAPHPTCPAFGGVDLSMLYITTARQGLTLAQMAAASLSGQTFQVTTQTQGQAEHRVVL